MRHFSYLFLVLIIGCKSIPEPSTSERVEKIMSFIASDELNGRESGGDGITAAANYVEAVFKESKILPYFNNYRDTLSNFDKEAYNIVGYIEGVDKNLKNEFVVIGAHYDHIGIIKSTSTDSIANGANDNASGTTMVLELARYFGGTKKNKRSIIFAFFSAEEKGLLGSRHLAEKLSSENLSLYTMLNFEMVGVPLENKDYLIYVTGYEESNLAAACNNYASEKLVGFLPTSKKYNLFKRSDNYPFHEMFNVPSQTFSTFDFTNYDQYHKVGDENELMNFEHMASIANKMIPVMESIINAPEREIKYN